MSVQCDGASRGGAPCRRHGEPNATGEFWCHSHRDQFATLIRNWQRIQGGGAVAIRHNNGALRHWTYDPEARTAVEVSA